MMVLVTGGAGFVGSHLVDELVAQGHDVVVYDSLDAQVHLGGKPAYLAADAEFVMGDVRDRDLLQKCLLEKRIEVVFHQAAVVGVGQSMYEIRRYVDVNSVGTATLLDILANSKHHVGKIVVASSMSIYGEGSYRCPEHGIVYPRLRSAEQLANHDWEMRCPVCGAAASPTLTREDKPLYPTSTYATSKRDQEELVLQFGQAYEVPAVALRYFNIYGTRQSLSNPYTGVAAIFASRLLNGHKPLIFEDGLQARDFVHVSDIVRANMLAMEQSGADYCALNVGTGRSTTVRDVAVTLAGHLKLDIEPEILGEFRAGDIRNCVADVADIKERLGFTPATRFEDGMRELAEWLRHEESDDRSEVAIMELRKHGLTSRRDAS
jgi:dTDP-L-rhamnose 4-epimerase